MQRTATGTARPLHVIVLHMEKSSDIGSLASARKQRSWITSGANPDQPLKPTIGEIRIGEAPPNRRIRQ